MPINPSLLVAAPMLQDYFVDKNGLPMAAGIITCYHDNSRTTLKNWYYQSGTQGSYTYIPLPNPLTLSAAGTICDINGVDTIPFFYPYLESDNITRDPYYIVIENFDQTNQITRENFPPLGNSNVNPITNANIRNLIINNGFWRNILPNYVNTVTPASVTLSNSNSSTFLSATSVNIGSLTNLYVGTVAPSQHDGFAFTDIKFMKNNLSANETCTFLAFPFSTSLIIAGANTPEYYLNHQSTTAGSAETFKGYLFPIALHINNLANLNYTVSIQARSNLSSSNTIRLSLLQYLGTGAATPAPTVVANTSLTLTTSWASYSLTDIFPTAAGLTTSLTEDDAFYLLVTMPLNQICNIDFTKPAVYLTAGAVPSVDFQNYDQVNSIICSNRTGDFRFSLSIAGVPQFTGPLGWVYANDGTIGSATSGATSRANADTWPLYVTLWNNVSNAFAPVTGGRGVSALADFIANKPIALTKTLARLLGVAGPGAGLTFWSLGQFAGAESASVPVTINNMPSHNHPGSTVALGISDQGGTPSGFVTAATIGPTALSIAPEGNGVPLTVPTIPPSFYSNCFIKL